MKPGPAPFHALLIAGRQAAASIDGSLARAASSHRSTALHDLANTLRHLDRLEDPEIPAAELPHLVIVDPDVPGPELVRLLTRIKEHRALTAVPLVVLPVGFDDVRNPGASARTRALIETLHADWVLANL